MDPEVSGARWFNKLLTFLIGAQLILLLGIAIAIVFSLVDDVLSVTSVASYVSLVLLSLPLSYFLYRSSDDAWLQRFFLALMSGYVLLSLSGITWYLAPLVVASPFAVPAAKALMVVSYLPLLVTLFLWIRSEWGLIETRLKTFIASINTVAVIIILLFVIVKTMEGGAAVFDVSVYTASVVFDIAILTAAAVLTLNHMQNQFRYVSWMLLVYFLLSLAGDALSLLGYLGVIDTVWAAQYFFDLMLIFSAAALLLYAVTRVRITTVEEVSRKLSDTRGLVSDLVMQSPDAICIFDAGGDAVLANDAFVRLAGHDPAGRLNLFRDAGSLIAGSGAHMARARDGELLSFQSVKPWPERGGDRFYDAKIFPAYSSGSMITSYIIFLSDITERMRYEEELLRAKAQAELCVDLMGHDINNMNQIGIGYLEMALDRLRPAGEDRLFIDKPLEAMINSSRLISNIKKICYARSGITVTEPVDLGRVLDAVVGEYREVPGRDVSIEYLPVSGFYVQANSLLMDVFENLLNNAIKHSSGPLKVGVSIVMTITAGGVYHQVTIEDNGPGIPDKAKATLFDRMAGSRARTGGSGLGLYLVKTLVDSFWGTIAVEDRVQGDSSQGTRFIVTLPALGSRKKRSPAGDSEDARAQA
jgi:signal transduction histidine kinase